MTWSFGLLVTDCTLHIAAQELNTVRHLGLFSLSCIRSFTSTVICFALVRLLRAGRSAWYLLCFGRRRGLCQKFLLLCCSRRDGKSCRRVCASSAAACLAAALSALNLIVRGWFSTLKCTDAGLPWLGAVNTAWSSSWYTISDTSHPRLVSSSVRPTSPVALGTPDTFHRCRSRSCSKLLALANRTRSPWVYGSAERECLAALSLPNQKPTCQWLLQVYPIN